MRGQWLTRGAALRRMVVVIAAAITLGLQTARAGSIDFSELPNNTPVDGVSVKGVGFKYSVNGVPSTDAHFTNVGPGPTTLSQPPNLEAGTAGILTLTFATPVREVGFAYLAAYPSAATDGFKVTLEDTSGASFTKEFPIARIGMFSGARYDSAAGNPIVRAILDPNEARGVRFIIDNLTFTPVPEPGALLPLSGCTLALLARRRRRG